MEWSGALGFGGEWSLVLLLCLSVVHLRTARSLIIRRVLGRWECGVY